MANTSSRAPSTSIFIGNVGFAATEEELSTIFKQVGPLKSFRLVTDKDSGKPKGYAFAEYFDVQTAQSAQRNLNNTDLNGRSLRVDFADNEKYSTERNGQKSGEPRVQPVGQAAVQQASQNMAAALGGAGGTGQQQISEALSKMTRPQLYEIMSQMKSLIQQNPAQARQILVQNPQLTKALFQAQLMLGMVSATSPVVNGGQSALQDDPTPLPQPQQQVQAQPQPQIQNQVHMPPMQNQGQPQHLQPPGPPQFGLQPGTAGFNPLPAGFQQPVPQASFPPQQQTLPRPQTLSAPMAGGLRPFQQMHPQPQAGPRPITHPGPIPSLHQQQQQPFDPRQPGPQVSLDPRQQQQHLGHAPRVSDPRQQPSQDPRLQMQQDPRQMQQDPRQQQQDPRQLQPTTQQPSVSQPVDPRQLLHPSPNPHQQGFSQQPMAAPAALGPAEQHALLRQVMNLTPQQVEMLPEAQKQQVLELQRQLRTQGGM